MMMMTMMGMGEAVSGLLHVVHSGIQSEGAEATQGKHFL